MDPLFHLALRGVQTKMADSYHIMLHFLLAFYLSNLSKAENLLGLKRDNLPDFLCQKGLFHKENMPCSPNRHQEHGIIHMFEAFEVWSDSVRKTLYTTAMFPLHPVQASFP